MPPTKRLSNTFRCIGTPPSFSGIYRFHFSEDCGIFFAKPEGYVGKPYHSQVYSCSPVASCIFLEANDITFYLNHMSSLFMLSGSFPLSVVIISYNVRTGICEKSDILISESATILLPVFGICFFVVSAIFLDNVRVS